MLEVQDHSDEVTTSPAKACLEAYEACWLHSLSCLTCSDDVELLDYQRIGPRRTSRKRGPLQPAWSPFLLISIRHSSRQQGEVSQHDVDHSHFQMLEEMEASQRAPRPHFVVHTGDAFPFSKPRQCIPCHPNDNWCIEVPS